MTTMVVVQKVLIMLVLSTKGLSTVLHLLPHVSGEEKEKPLVSAEGAVKEVLSWTLHSRGSVILLYDHTVPHAFVTLLKEVGRMVAPWGMTALQAPPSGAPPSSGAVQNSEELVFNLTQTSDLSFMLTQARDVRERSWSVVVVVVSDDPTFLATVAHWCFQGRLLTWPHRLVALTSRPLQELVHLHPSFSMINSILLVQDPTAPSPRCKVYVHLPYTEGQVLQVASWSVHKGLTLSSHLPLFPDKFYRFLHRPLLVVTAEEFPPHMVVRDVAQGTTQTTDHTTKTPGTTGTPGTAGRAGTPGTSKSAGEKIVFSGSMIQVADLLSCSLNFSYKLVRPPDYSFGTRLPDGSATGMVGLEVHLGLGPFGITAARSKIIDYTTPIVSDSLRIMGGRGLPEVDPWGFLLPLAPLVWVTMLGSLVLNLATVFLLHFWFVVKKPIFSSYVRILLQENTYVCEVSLWERWVVGSWLLVMLVVTLSYTGNLMSLLAVRYIPQPLQSLRALLDHPAITMVWEHDTAYVHHFRASESGILSEVRARDLKGDIRYVLTTEHRYMQDQLVRPGTHAFIGEHLTINILVTQDFSHTGRCDFYTSREAFMPFLYAMIGPKNSPLIPAISKRITRIREAGLYSHWMKNYNSNSSVCLRPPTKISVKSSLSLANVWGMFVVFAGGNTIGLFFLGVEVLASHLLRNN